VGGEEERTGKKRGGEEAGRQAEGEEGGRGRGGMTELPDGRADTIAAAHNGLKHNRRPAAALCRRHEGVQRRGGRARHVRRHGKKAALGTQAACLCRRLARLCILTRTRLAVRPRPASYSRTSARRHGNRQIAGDRMPLLLVCITAAASRDCPGVLQCCNAADLS